MDRPLSLLEQHEELRIVCDRLHLIASSQAVVVSDESFRAILRHDLAELRRQLEAHFAFETQGGYLREVTERHPDTRSSVERLEEQHGEILKKLDALARPEKADSLADLRRGALEALILLKQHEVAEVELFQRGLD